MPNVNYRGKPSQDPNAPPESGVTSIPLGAPWPPLSREQVAELHQELVEFYAGMKRCVDLGINDSARAAYAERLTIVLHQLGIGSPPSTKTWTHEEIAKVAEEVQDGAHQTPMEPAWLRLDWGSSVLMPVKNVSGQGLAEGQMVTTAQVQVEPPKRNCWTCGSFHINNGCGKKWTASAALAAHLRKMDDLIDGGASTTEVASMDLNCPGWERKP